MNKKTKSRHWDWEGSEPKRGEKRRRERGEEERRGRGGGEGQQEGPEKRENLVISGGEV